MRLSLRRLLRHPGARRTIRFLFRTRGRSRRGGSGSCGLFLDLAKQRSDRHRLPAFGGNLREHTGSRRGHLHRHLVRLELHQRLGPPHPAPGPPSGPSSITASPCCLNHLPIVASVTDSPNVGTRISAMLRILTWPHPSASSKRPWSCLRCCDV